MSVAAAQRYSAAQRCPICGGYSTGTRGTAAHCFGYLSTDGQYAHCTRTEQAGSIERHPVSDTFPHRMVGPCRCGQTHGAQAIWEKPHVNGNGKKIVATYDYRTAGGDLAYQAVRYEPKDFRQRRPAGDGWDWHLADTPRVLYRLPELLAAPKDEPIWIAEGEKDVETLRGMGLVATCNVMGKGKWLPQYGEHLAGRTVLILYDRDKDQGGYRHAQDIKVKLSGYASKAAIIDLPSDAHDVTDWVGLYGGSISELKRIAHAVLHPPPPIRILSAAQLLDLPPLAWLFEPFLPENGFVTLIGETNKGKTFCAVDMAGRIALDGKKVLYIIGEGQRGISMRYNAWRMFYNGGEHLSNLFFITEPVFPTVAEMMTDLYLSMEMAGCARPGLIVFDTLFMCFRGDVNGQGEMKDFVDAVTALRIKTGACIVFVHHTGWDNTRMGGNRQLQNAADVEMFVTQDEMGTISLSCTKMRDGERFDPRHFRLRGVESTGSCVLIPTEASPKDTTGLPENYAAVLAALVAAAGTGLAFNEAHERGGLGRSATTVDVLKSLELSGHVKASGEAGRRNRRYYAREFFPKADPNTFQKDTDQGDFPSGIVTVRYGSLVPVPYRNDSEGNQKDEEQDNEFERGLVRNVSVSLRNEGERPVISCKSCGRWMWTQVGRDDGSWHCSNCGVDYQGR